MSERSPYLLGPYAPVDREVEADDLEVSGEVPKDLAGLYVRNGPNPRFDPPGRYHWFDGDGMLHAALFRDGRIAYRNRWVRTRALEAEVAAGEALFGGVMEPVRQPAPTGPYKDTANTDVVFHGGALTALWYISGEPYRVDPRTLETLGRDDFGGRRQSTVSAHPKVDPRTGECLYFTYGFRPPFMRYGVVDANGDLVHETPVELPGPRLPHDMAITERFSVLMDLPVFYDTEALAAGRWVTRYHPELPSRFGILPRRGDGREIRWFDAEPGYVYHTTNAWEDGDEVVMVGCKVDDPLPAPRREDGPWAKMMANLRVTAKLYRWRFNLETGAVKEETLDDLNTEFPMGHLGRLGRPTRYSYNVTLADAPTLLFDGLVKYDVNDGTRTRYAFPKGVYGSEAPFCPRVGATEEDDGYLVTFVTDAVNETSELWIFDARQLDHGPVAKARLPQRVPNGFHATWVPMDQLDSTPERS